MKGSLHNKSLLFVILGTLVFCLSYDATMYCVSWPTEICWRCRASKGNECFDTVYTDFSSTAGWRSMGFSNPWQTKPFLAELWGWDPQLHMVSVDLLHVLHLGVYRDLAGSAIKVLLRKQGYYDGSKLLIRFKAFTRELKAWAKSTKATLQLKAVKKATVYWKSDQCPELHAKGADCATIIRFLAFKTQQKTPPMYAGMVACLWAASNFLGLLMTAGLYLTKAEQETGHALGSMFLDSYFRLAREAVDNNDLLWKTRPKIHFLCHVVDDLLIRSRNMARDSTFMDEDVMKYILFMKRGLKHRQSPVNVLKRYNVVLKRALDRADMCHAC